MTDARMVLVLTLTVIGVPALSPCRCGEEDPPDGGRMILGTNDVAVLNATDGKHPGPSWPSAATSPSAAR